MYQVTFLPILFSGIACVIFGAVWYHPRLLGGVWMRHAGFSPEMVERSKKRAPFLSLLLFLLTMFIAWTMNYVGIAFAVNTLVQAIVVLALSLWLGFAAPVLMMTLLFDQRSFKLILIHLGYWLVAFFMMALILLGGALLSADQSATSSDTAYPAAE